MTQLNDTGLPTPELDAPNHRGRRIAGMVLGVVAASGIAVAIVCATDARAAYDQLQAAAPAWTTLQEQTLAGNPAATETVTELQEHAAAARDAVHGPHWSLVRALPLAGPNVRAAQEVTSVIDQLARTALPDLVDAASVLDLSTLMPADARVDLRPLEGLGPKVTSADESVREARERLAAIDTSAVDTRLAAPIDRFTAQLGDLGELTATAARAAALLPPMLGAEGERDYLLLVQNNAEPRAGGGIAGSVLHLRANDGVVEVVDQRPGTALGRTALSAPQLREEELTLLGRQSRGILDITATPHFPRAAELARQVWEAETDVEVDGVLATDPVALEHVLRAAGPVTMPGGQVLTGENAARTVLNAVYLEMPGNGDLQDAFFEDAALGAFDRLLAGGADGKDVIDALDLSADEGRLMIWSAHPAEQALLSGTVLGGELRGEVGRSPVVGVYVNDTTGSKLGYYQRTDVAVRPLSCPATNPQELEVRVRVRSEVPPALVTGELPRSLLSTHGAAPGTLRSAVHLYAPTGGTVTAAGGSGEAWAHDGLEVLTRTVELRPGESAELVYEVTAPADGAPVVRLTPGPAADASEVAVTGCSVDGE